MRLVGHLPGTYLVPSSRVKNLKLFGFLTLEDGTSRLS